MAEQTLASPLSGLEVRKAILARVESALERDCYLNPNSAYDWFSAEISIDLDLSDAGAHVQSNFAVAASLGEEKPATESAQVELHLDPAPPNEVRIDTGQEVPVLTKDDRGRPVVKGVKYAKRKTS